MTHYPRPTIPTSPILSWKSFTGGRKPSIPSVLEAGASCFLTSGRMAIAMALKLIGVGPGDKILLPAYHCSSMVEPVIWTGADCVFYRIRPDTTVDLDDLQSKLDASTRVIVLTHYFGFHQPSPIIRKICDQHRLFLIEDCAHAFFGSQGGQPLGSYGDYTIASLIKFFPIFDGGCLVSAQHPLNCVKLEPKGFSFEAKAALNNLERALEYNRLRPGKILLKFPLGAKNLIWNMIKVRSKTVSSRAYAPQASEGGYGFDPAWINKRVSITSRLIMKMSNRQRIIEHRRRNFLRFLKEFDSLPGCRPLFMTLTESTVPYMFPLLLDEPKKVFPRLKRKGVPVLRFGEYLWEGVNETVCPVSVDLSRRLLQFPCHQELRPTELEWIIAQVKATLRE